MNESLIKKLEKIYERYNELEKLLSDPGVIADSNRYTAYMKEHGNLSKMVSKYMQLTETRSKKKETMDFLTQESADKELSDMAKDELGELEKQEDAIFGEIKDLFITDDKKFNKNVIAEIRAGTGGGEAALFALIYSACTPSTQKIRDGRLNFLIAMRQTSADTKKLLFLSKGKMHIRNCVLKVVHTAFKEYLEQRQAVEYTLRPLQ